MSDRNQSDTSRIVKNPLLSASVTGLTFDDFTHHAVLLPAAAIPPSIPDNKIAKDLDQIKSVHFGDKPTVSLDTETFSEISLDQSSDAESYPPPPPIYNPLQDTQPSTTQDSAFNPLAQATAITASLSQLPSVASSVLSSFSSILRGGSPVQQQQLDESSDQTVLHKTQTQYKTELDQLFEYQTSHHHGESIEPIIAPTFYSPNDSQFLPAAPLIGSALPSSNAYRLSAKRKTYAPVPGLSASHILQEQNTASVTQQPAHNIPPIPPILESSDPPQPLPDTSQKTQDSKFSLSSFFSAPIKFPLSSSNPKTDPQYDFSTDVFSVNTFADKPISAQQNHPAPISTSFINPSLFNTKPGNSTVAPLPFEQQTVGNLPETVNSQNPIVPLLPTSQPTPLPPQHSYFNPVSNPHQTDNIQAIPSIPNQFSLPNIVSPHPTPPPPQHSYFNSVSVTQTTENISETQTAQVFLQPNYPTQIHQIEFFNPVTGLHEVPNSTGVAPPIPTQFDKTIVQPKQPPTQVDKFNPTSLSNYSNFGKEETSNYPPPLLHSPNLQPLIQTATFVPTSIGAPPIGVPPIRNTPSSYRLKGKPHYKLPTSTYSARVPLQTDNPQALPPNVSIFNPLQSEQIFRPEQILQPEQIIQREQILQPEQIQQPTLSSFFNSTPFVSQPITSEVSSVSSIPNCNQSPNLQQQSLKTGEHLFQPIYLPPVSVSESVVPLNVQSELSTEPRFIAVCPQKLDPVSHQDTPELSSSHEHIQPERQTSTILLSNQNQKEETNPSKFNLFNALNIGTEVIDSNISNFFNPAPVFDISNTPAWFNPIKNIDSENTKLITVPLEVAPNNPPKSVPLEAAPNFESQPISFEAASSYQSQPIPLEVTENYQSQSIPFEFAPNYQLELDSNYQPEPVPFEIPNNYQSQAIHSELIPSISSQPDSNQNFEKLQENPINFFINNQPQPTEPQPQEDYFQIQNFFNNPPLLTDTQEGEQDRNFNLIESNLINKRLENISFAASETEVGSISSNLVEPPSSAQSELSEYAELSLDASIRNAEYSLKNLDQTDAANLFTLSDQQTVEMAASSQLNQATGISTVNVAYRPVYKHWFYKKTDTDVKLWSPFSMADSLKLEEATQNEIITTDGGRYDVNVDARTRLPIYWNGTPDEVRRCSWFYKGTDSRFVPYDEETSDRLEDEYKEASNTGEWHRKLALPGGETIVFHGASVIVHFLQAQSPDGWTATSTPQAANRPRVVKRGIDEFNIDDGEPEQIDHLLFMVHGIGAGCDLKFRSIEEVVDDFRVIALQLTESHYRSSCDKGQVGRIEVLPISWHSELHSQESGIDEKLKSITLESIPKLRAFTNDTLLDILFYTSPVFCQHIMEAVSGSLNLLYSKFCERNPLFHGDVSLAGHSLGSLILFDLLQNQRAVSQMETENCENPDDQSNTAMQPVRAHKPLTRAKSQQINYTIGQAGTGQPFIRYPQLNFKPKKFFALGSPIGMFVTVRGIDTLGLDFKLPTTDGFYNIFHPYDPVAYRIEALVNSELGSMRPVLIPHHKGRKRMHLELRETMARVGADLKQKISDTFKTTMNTVYHFTSLNKSDPKAIQQEVDKVLEQQLSLDTNQRQRLNSGSTASSEQDTGETDIPLGILNEGKRIDYVLQEAPLEFFNEYLFALTSHVCYWDSEDTTLFIIKEIYSSLGVQTDSRIPQQTMTIERPTSSNSPTSQSSSLM